MVSTETLAKTARLRAILAFLLVFTSTFMIASMSTRGGWALGQITTIWTLPTTTTASCPDKVPTGSTCQVVSTVTEVIVAELNYGLFGDVKYVTDTNSVTSWTLSVDGGPAVKQDPLASHGLEDVNLQPDYKIWAKGNPPYINNVRATQAFALWAFFSTVVAGVILLAALHMSPSKRLAEWRIKVGFYWLLLSWFSLFLTFVIWVGTPVSAFTNACEACDNPALCAKDYACVQLNGGLCPPSEKEKGACEVNADVTKAGGMWGLIFFSFLLQFFAMVVWRKLYADVVRSSYEDNRPNMGVMPSDGPGEPTATDYNNL